MISWCPTSNVWMRMWRMTRIMEKAEHVYTIRNYRGKREEVRGKR
jgi:hypothetical protein